MSEQKRRPELTTIIAGSTSEMQAGDVAKKALDGLKKGQFIIPYNFEGAMLAIVTSGLSPQRSAMTGLLEVLGAGLMRLVALVFQWNWYSAIQNWRAKQITT